MENIEEGGSIRHWSAVSFGCLALGFGFLILTPLLGWVDLHLTPRGTGWVHWLGALLWGGAFMAGVYLLLVWPLYEWLLPQYQWNGPMRVAACSVLWAIPLMSFVYFLTGSGSFDVPELLWIVLPWVLVGAIIGEGSGSPGVAAVVLALGITLSVRGIHDAVGPFPVLASYLAYHAKFYVLRDAFALLAVAASALFSLRHWQPAEWKGGLSALIVIVAVVGFAVHIPVGLGLSLLLGLIWLPHRLARPAVLGVAVLGLVLSFLHPSPLPILSLLAVSLYVLAGLGSLRRTFQ